VVQDSGDFDKDYVKDENSDDGHWKAQQEYDRLRHKLEHEKKEAAKALEKKKEEEQELKQALDKYSKEAHDKQQADAAKQKKKEGGKHMEKAEVKKRQTPTQTEKVQGWSWSWPFSWPFSWPKSVESDPPAAEPVFKKGTGVRSATKDTEKAMDNLKACQDDLAKARDELKNLMEELDEAKGKQSKATAAFDTAAKKHLEAKKIAEDFRDSTSKEEAEHATVEAAYLKQKARVDKLQVDLDAAAAKVKAQRDAEDTGGGVHNTHTTKSFSMSLTAPWALVLMLGAVASLEFA